MVEQHNKIDRRTLLKLMGTGGAAAASTGAITWGMLSSVRAADDIRPGIDPFEVHVSDDELEDLRRRLAMTRWARHAPGKAWALGSDRAYLEELIAYWRDEYDWRKHEAELNKFDHYTTTIDGQLIHFVRQKASGKSSLPLLMTHGWPGTIWDRRVALGASTPWKRMRWSRGRGTRAAKRYRNSSGAMTTCVVPSR